MGVRLREQVRNNEIETNRDKTESVHYGMKTPQNIIIGCHEFTLYTEAMLREYAEIYSNRLHL